MIIALYWFLSGSIIHKKCYKIEDFGEFCEMGLPDAIANPVSRPISFLFLNFPNYINGKNLSDKVPLTEVIIYTVFDLPLFFLFSIILYRLFCMAVKKNFSYKKIFYGKQKMLNLIFIVIFLLVIFNMFVYFSSPKFKEKNNNPVEFQFEKSDDFNDDLSK